jgi:hypothetical protein
VALDQHLHKVISVTQIIEEMLDCLPYLINVVKRSLNICKLFDKLTMFKTSFLELREIPEEQKDKILVLLQNIPTDLNSEAYTLWCANMGNTVPLVYDQRLRKPFWTYHAHLKVS